jgi:MarR family transcriptional regulator, 2-MHQ and catechol-resistance regulon repressor
MKILENPMDLDTKLMVAHTRLAHSFMISLGKNLEELGLSVSHYSILDHLDHVGMAKTQALCRVALLTSGSVTHAVNQLAEKGHVRKVPCTKDKRVTWVELTPSGKVAFKAIQTKHLSYLNWLFEDFSDDEKHAFINQIKHFGLTITRKIAHEQE